MKSLTAKKKTHNVFQSEKKTKLKKLQKLTDERNSLAFLLSYIIFKKKIFIVVKCMMITFIYYEI